jgi:aspartyl-tRNA(Asn)/glutamyl-tRNA(Gln) amidotransferase subunit C
MLDEEQLMTADSKSSSAFKIDVDMVKHVAYLVRLGISEAEALEFSKQFTSIIDHFHLLNEVDTTDIPSAAQFAGTGNVMREDVATPSMSRDEFLQNAPRRDGGFVKVPIVADLGGLSQDNSEERPDPRTPRS